MSGIATAIVGSAVIGGAVASNSASKAAKSAKQSSDAQMQFEYDKLAEWEEAYGPIEDNLSQYYQNLTPEYYEVQGLEAFEQEQQQSLQTVRENLAQRGIGDSGIAAQAEIQFGQQEALGRAKIRTEAPRKVAEEQARFLQVGLGQDPQGSVSQTLAQNTQYAQNVARTAEQQAGQAVGSAVKTIGTGIADYLRTPTPPVDAGATSANYYTDYSTTA